MKNLYFKGFLLALVFMACQCKDDDMSFDPCEDISPTSADFWIYPNTGFVPPPAWQHIDTDTLSFSSGGIFAAKYPADKRTWLIGSEILEDSVISRTDFPPGEDITVTLIVENFNPNSDCFPNDTGRDTFSRTFHALGPVEKLKWEGEYMGTYDFLPNESQQFVLNRDSFWVYDLPYSGCQHRFDLTTSTYSSVLFRIVDVTDQTGKCEEDYSVFMTVTNDSFSYEIVGSLSNPERDGAFMRGVKIQ